MTKPRSAKLLLVDDHQIVRTGLKALARSTSEVNIEWFEAGSLKAARACYEATPDIDLVMLDLNLPDGRGLQALVEFRASFPLANVVVFSGIEEPIVIRQALALGALGYIPKSGPAERTLALIGELLATIGPDGIRRGPRREESESSRRIGHLTPAQLRVLELVLEGKTNQQIAETCHLALGTVKNTVSAILLILDVQSRSQLVGLFR
jgi:DNA-binding NarL/FixJ family response regulator